MGTRDDCFGIIFLLGAFIVGLAFIAFMPHEDPYPLDESAPAALFVGFFLVILSLCLMKAYGEEHQEEKQDVMSIAPTADIDEDNLQESTVEMRELEKQIELQELSRPSSDMRTRHMEFARQELDNSNLEEAVMYAWMCFEKMMRYVLGKIGDKTPVKTLMNSLMKKSKATDLGMSDTDWSVSWNYAEIAYNMRNPVVHDFPDFELTYHEAETLLNRLSDLIERYYGWYEGNN